MKSICSILFRTSAVLCFALFLGSCTAAIDSGKPAASACFMRIYGGTFDEQATAILSTSDGGSLALGSTTSSGHGGEDFYLVRFDQNGYAQWQQEYGTVADEAPASMSETSDGYLLVGTTMGFGYTVPGMYLVQIDAVGDTLWTRHITADTGTISCAPASLVSCPDGGFVIAGSASRDGMHYAPFFVRIDRNGSLLWRHVYYDSTGSIDTRLHGTLRAANGNIIAVGSRNSGSTPSIYFLETDSSGMNPTAALLQNTNGEGYAIDLDPNGYVVFGRTSTAGASTLYITTAFSFTTGPAPTPPDTTSRFMFGKRTSDGGTIAIGSGTSPSNGSQDLIAMKTDRNQHIEWVRYYGGTGADQGMSVAQTSDGGYLLLGTTQSPSGRTGKDILLIKVDANGSLCN